MARSGKRGAEARHFCNRDLRGRKCIGTETCTRLLWPRASIGVYPGSSIQPGGVRWPRLDGVSTCRVRHTASLAAFPSLRPIRNSLQYIYRRPACDPSMDRRESAERHIRKGADIHRTIHFLSGGVRGSKCRPCIGWSPFHVLNDPY